MEQTIKGRGLWALGFLVLAASVWSLPAQSASYACRNNDGRKICTDLSVQPAERVQPAGQGGTPTYVYYTAKLSNLSMQSTRFVTLTMKLSPATGFTSLSTDGGQCELFSGNQVKCYFDKLLANQVITIKAQALVPPYQTADQPDYLLTNTTTFGWQGNTAQADKSVTVSVNGGSSYIPPNQRVTLVTSPENADPAEQVTPENPLFGKLTIPPGDGGYSASLTVVSDGPTQSLACIGGFYYSTGSDGGPYVCRDPDQPNRWVKLALSGGGVETNQPFYAIPLEFVLAWDASIVPVTQLDPAPPVYPTGLPPFAVFFQGVEPDGTPGTTDDNTPGETRAIASSCDSTQPPCLSVVKKYSTGDWTATLLKSTAGGEPEGPGPVLTLPSGDIGVLGIFDPPPLSFTR